MISQSSETKIVLKFNTHKFKECECEVHKVSYLNQVVYKFRLLVHTQTQCPQNKEESMKKIPCINVSVECINFTLKISKSTENNEINKCEDY